MRIKIYAEGFQLSSQLRALAEVRLLSALGPFRKHIELAVVHLGAGSDRTQSDTTSCDVVVTLLPSGEVRARAREGRMEGAIDRATERIGGAVEHAVSQTQAPSAASPVVRHAIGHGAIELVLDGNRISQHDREMLERPENYLRPVIAREYWRPPGAEHEEPLEERETVGLATFAGAPETIA